MSEQYLGYQPETHWGGDATLIEPLAAGRPGADIDPGIAVAATAAEIEDVRALKQAANEQLERDLADIERATAALRRAEPALQSWSQPVKPTVHPPQPLWVLIGVLWLSAAIVTAGAAAAIAALAG